MKRILIILIAVPIFIALGWNYSKSRNYQLFGEIISNVETDTKIVALTFDDGPWNSKYTEEVLSVLDELEVKGTFFLNGRGIEANINDAKKIVSSGHAIGNHSYSHNTLIFRGYEDIAEEVEHTNELIRSAGYVGEIFFRPPYGKKLFMLPYFLNKNGMTTVTWNVEPESYKEATKNSSSMVEHVVNNTDAGSIILLHVLGSKNGTSRDALPLIINRLRAKGYRFVLLPELFRENV